MRTWLHRALPILMLGGLAWLALPLAPAAAPAASVAGMHLSLESTPPPSGFGAHPSNAIPPVCSMWHELWPFYCQPHHQDNYWDNGDGVVSACDYIILDGLCYHVDWVGPTYYMTRLSPPPAVTLVAEPELTNPTESPECEVWHVVFPDFCTERHVDSWHDSNQNAQLDACDEIDFQPPQVLEPEIWHIDKIALDIVVSPGPTPTHPDTWGRLKVLYR